MADLQRQLLIFDRTIRLGTMDEEQILREKRDRLVRDLSLGLKKRFASTGERAPLMRTFNQGSYAMRTGIRPLTGEYDIDVGVVFDIDIRKHHDPVQVKSWVADALSVGARAVQMRRSCVTVSYTERGRVTHHVDLAVYARGRTGSLYLARGMLNSQPRLRRWDPADPSGLIERVQNHLDGENRAQFLRTVRLLKRWRDHCFQAEGRSAPVGIALTVLALAHFQPVLVRRSDGKYVPDDLSALRRFIRRVLTRFELVVYDTRLVFRLPAVLPVKPRSNVLLRLSNSQMAAFRTELRTLLHVLEEVSKQNDITAAVKGLRCVLGSDFPTDSR